MSRYRRDGPRCTGITMAGTRYERQCFNAPVPGSKRCHVHGERPARLIVKQGRRRGYVDLSCVHLAIRVTLNAGEPAATDWRREVLHQTRPHSCFAALRARYLR